MDSDHHRKIELQSPEDLRYLIDNVSRRAREKIDLNLPPSAAPEGEDALRRRVEELVHEYVQQIFELARHSISINGMDASAVSEIFSRETEEFEPYDRRLHSRVQVLQSSLESSTLSLSSLRREAPAAAADAYVRRSNEQAAATTAAVAALNAAATGTADAAQPALLDLKPLERQADVERAYGTGLEELGALKSRLPATAARLERAKDAAEYVEKSR
ncbi:MAG: hypothetical protein M1813_005897 [Trichoglossum hirsutum]|nr:MAG: hypothetical protein M1813_005897 [Trichoglossum hirsutum]